MKALRTISLILTALAGIIPQASFAGFDPTQGRFLSRDPIEESGGVSLYGFVQNRPISSFDPIGLSVYIVEAPKVKGENSDATSQVKKDHEEEKRIALQQELLKAGERSAFYFGSKKVTRQEWETYVKEDVIEVDSTAGGTKDRDINLVKKYAGQAKREWDIVFYAKHGMARGNDGGVVYTDESFKIYSYDQITKEFSAITTSGGKGVQVSICKWLGVKEGGWDLHYIEPVNGSVTTKPNTVNKCLDFYWTPSTGTVKNAK